MQISRFWVSPGCFEPDRAAKLKAGFSCLAASLLFASLPCLGAQLAHNAQARAGISLDGAWARIIDPLENGYFNHRMVPHEQGYFANVRPSSPSDLVEYDFSASPVLQVPGDWNSQEAELFFYEGTVWYQRDFSLEKKPGRRYLVHFGAVNYRAIVYVNGVRVGEHEGGFTPFQFDITEQVRDGDNFIVVKADNRREPDNVPTVNFDWWNYGGITRSVRILDVPEPYLADYSLRLAQAGQVEGWVRATGSGSRVVLDINGLVSNLAIDIDPGGFGTFSLEATPELWSPESPKLYDVQWRYNGEIVADRVGFRKVAVEGTDILLNGAPVFLRGVSLHEETPDGGSRAWSEEQARRMLSSDNENMVKMADEMGLLVWSEIPVYWTVAFTNPAVYAKAENQLAEMIERDRNRASIVLWSIANETPTVPGRLEFLGGLAEKARSLDDSRLITAALDTHTSQDGVMLIEDPLAAVVDVIGINSYCGWYAGTPERCAGWSWHSAYDKPVIISEFGAGALQGLHGTDNQRWTEEYQSAVYRNNLAMMDNIEFLSGMTPWILKDFRSPRRPLPGIQDYWNRKGLLSETGEKKAAWYLMKAYYDSKIAESR
jgi:beta-glucuronidase